MRFKLVAIAVAVALGLTLAVQGPAAADPPWTLTMTTSTTELTTNSTATLTAVANQYPYGQQIQIYDASTGQRKAGCGYMSCSFIVDYSPNPQSFIAYVGDYSATAPPANLQATSSTITITPAPWVLTLTTDKTLLTTGDSATLTATTNQVATSSQMVQIYDGETGTRIKACSSGTTCQTYVDVGTSPRSFFAYVAPASGTSPPAGWVAKTDGTFIAGQPWTVSLVTANGGASLLATANQSVSGTGNFISIYDASSGTRLTSCSVSTACSTVIAAPVSPHRFLAVVETVGSGGVRTASAWSNTVVLPDLAAVGSISIRVTGSDQVGHVLLEAETTGIIPAGYGPIIVLDPGGSVSPAQTDATHWAASVTANDVAPPIARACIVLAGQTDCSDAVSTSSAVFATLAPDGVEGIPDAAFLVLTAAMTQRMGDVDYCAQLGEAFPSNAQFHGSEPDVTALCAAGMATDVVRLLIAAVGVEVAISIASPSPSKPLPATSPNNPPTTPGTATAPSPTPPSGGTTDLVDDLSVSIRDRIPKRSAKTVYLIDDNGIRYAARQCLALAEMAGLASPYDECRKDAIFLPGREIQDVAAHDFEAIFGSAVYNQLFSPDSSYAVPAHLSWVELNKWSGQTLQEGWYRGRSECDDATQANGLDCDEYPYRTTLQADPNESSLRPVILRPNRVEGWNLKNFYTKCQIQESTAGAPAANSEYLVIPMPADSAPLTFSVCR